MPYIPNVPSQTGSFVANTSVWDVSRLYEVDVNSDEFKELLVRLYQNVNNIALSLNTKRTATYLLNEFATSAQYFSITNNQLMLRPEYSITYNLGALAPGANAFAHGLTIGTTWNFVKIYGAATDNIGFNYYPLTESGTNNISLSLNATNIVIVNNSGITFTSCIVTLEYLKN